MTTVAQYTAMPVGRISFIGFGEAGRYFAKGIAPAVSGLSSWDLKLGSSDAPAMRAAMEALGVTPGQRPADALAGVEAAFSLVTADQAVVAADLAEGLPPGAFWIDGNSCGPGAKQRAAELIEAQHGRYVDLAIMAPVHPRGIQVPLLVSGPHAEDAVSLLERLGMRPRVVGFKVGQAAAIKMLRSIIIKGLEALTTECLVAAGAADVAEEVLDSLHTSDPGFDWAARAAYSLERMSSHGVRRAAEMREAARFLASLDLPNDMANATIAWQDRIGTLRLDLQAAAPGTRGGLVLAALKPTGEPGR